MKPFIPFCCNFPLETIFHIFALAVRLLYDEKTVNTCVGIFEKTMQIVVRFVLYFLFHVFCPAL